MAKHLAIALSAALLCSTSVAQNQAPTSADSAAAQAAQTPTAQGSVPSSPAGNQPQPTSPRLAPGSVIPVQLTKTVDAKKAKPGDEIVATVTHDLKSNTGEVVVPKDTKIVGHITEAQARTKEQKESELGIVFDRAVTKRGEMKQPMSIQAIIAPLDNVSGDDGGSDRSAPAMGGSAAPSPMGSRNASMGGAPPPPAPSPSAAEGTDAQAGGSARPPINGHTQGVIGMPELKLEASAQNAALGSVMSSGKGNVKLQSGTLMLLRVNP
ncbi:MAG: hypothetical protein WA604_14925 [Candidatus Sulfotelmatobacter sp.]